MRFNKIISAFGNAKEILEGVKNKVFKKQDVEDIADLRWMQCMTCSSLDEKGNKCAVPSTQPCCADCGCSLGLKLRALSSSCPQGKWQAIIDPNTERAVKKQIKEEEDASNI
jgi:hypothetical protein